LRVLLWGGLLQIIRERELKKSVMILD